MSPDALIEALESDEALALSTQNSEADVSSLKLEER